MRNPACWCSRTPAAFSRNRLPWMVQIPAASVEPISARSSAAPIPRRWDRGGRRRCARRPRIHAPGRDRGNGDPAQHPAVSISGGEPVPGELRRVERLPIGRHRLEAGLAGVQAGLVDRQHLAGVGRLHRPDDDPAGGVTVAMAAAAGISGGWSWSMVSSAGGFGVSRQPRAGPEPPTSAPGNGSAGAVPGRLSQQAGSGRAGADQAKRALK